MTPAEEQILRNQMMEITMLARLLTLMNSSPCDPERLFGLAGGLQCLEETELLLKTEHQQGRTVHAYTP